MKFTLEQATQILSRTPATLKALLSGLSNDWLTSNEGPETWSPYDVVGHLINAEKTNWLTRAKAILEHGETRRFEPFDRFAHFETSKGKTIDDLLEEFAAARQQNIAALHELKLSEDDLQKTGTHPEFGRVSLGELLATWVVHDLSHIRQITRTMAKQYAREVGPWQAYLSILQK